MRCGLMSVFETKSPGIHQRSHSDVKGPIGLTRDGHGLLKHLEKHLVGHHFPIFVDGRDNAFLVEGRQRVVHLHQFLLDTLMHIRVTLVGDMVAGAKDNAFILMVRHGLLLADDEHRTHDQ